MQHCFTTTERTKLFIIIILFPNGLGRDKTSHIFHHLQNSDECWRLSSESCFSILDTAPNRFQLKLKEAAHIRWTNPSLNRQLKHAELTF